MHGGNNYGAGPRLRWRSGIEAALKARRAKIELLHAFGQKAPGGRPRRIPYWLSRAVIEEAETELAGLDREAILTAELPPIDEMTDSEKLVWLERLDTASLISVLRRRPYRSAPAIVLAQQMLPAREMRIERGERQRGRLDRLIGLLTTR